MKIERVFDLLEWQLSKFAKNDTLSAKVNGKWINHSTAYYHSQAWELANGFNKKGIVKGDKIAIISPNRPEWNFVDMGAQLCGAIIVPLYPTITVDDYAFILNDSHSKIVFTANLEIYNKVKEASKKLNNPIEIYTFEKVVNLPYWEDVKVNVSDSDLTNLKDIQNQITESDIFTIIYTSGTTGTPKGVMLANSNMVSNFVSCFSLLPVNEESRALSFLPLCHVYERMLCYLYQYTGISIYYAESMETIGDNMKEIHPNIFVTVPRLLEKVYDKIVAKGMELKGVKRALFFWALELGLKYDMNQSQGFFYDLQLKLANKIIFNKWRDALGGSVKCIVSGGAALQPRLARIFSAAQIRVLEGYGLSETSPVIAVNRMEKENNRIGTVGPIIDGVQVKIASDGEILTKGPHIMKGYYNRPDLTAEVIDTEGWFHTGDIGEITEGKFLKITDRKKEIFKTSGGKYIAPQVIENKLKESKWVEQVMVLGDGRKFPSAIIVPSFAALKDYCNYKSIPYENDKSILTNNEVIKKFERDVESVNENLAQYEKIKKFKIISTPWTIDNGQMTPTLKLKRKNILINNNDLIEDMYKE